MTLSNIKMSFKYIAAALTLSALAACSDDNSAVAPTAGQNAPSVEVAQVISTQVAGWHEFTGTTVAPERIQLRPRVSGYLQEVHFVEGSVVQAGDLLFSIDAAPFLAEVNRLQAELVIAQSQEALAKKELTRANSLIKQKAISSEQLDARAANLQQASARINAVTAALLQAELQLDYTQITAPIAGTVSNAFITKGNFVNAGDSVLTTLVSNDKLHAYFDANQETYLEYAGAKNRAGSLPVLLSLSNSSAFTVEGEIDFIDNQIDVSTGTIRARALIENTGNALVPGLFTRLRVFESMESQSVLIDDKAIATDLSNKYVLVLNADNQVEYRAVTLGAKVNGLRIIEQGLEGDEQIVINGLQRVRPGAFVNPQLVAMTSDLNMKELNASQQQIKALRTKLRIAKELKQNSEQQATVELTSATVGA